MEKYIKIETKNSDLIIKLKGELDEYICSIIKAQIDYEYKLNLSKDIIFDFKEVTFIDSSTLGMVIGRYKKALENGGRVYIVGAKNQVEKIFEISNISSIISRFNNINEITRCS